MTIIEQKSRPAANAPYVQWVKLQIYKHGNLRIYRLINLFSGFNKDHMESSIEPSIFIFHYMREQILIKTLKEYFMFNI